MKFVLYSSLAIAAMHGAYDEFFEVDITVCLHAVVLGLTDWVDAQRAHRMSACVDFDHRSVDINLEVKHITDLSMEWGAVAVATGVLVEAALSHVTA